LEGRLEPAFFSFIKNNFELLEAEGADPVMSFPAQ
jgi:hypothetical protein